MNILKFACAILLIIGGYDAYSQTTIEEYNYLTKGYKLQLDAGLDMKSGYALIDLATHSTKQRSCDFKSLVKTGTKKTVATLCIFHAANRDTYYFCIPSSGSPQSLYLEYLNSLKILDNADAARDYALFLSFLYVKEK